ncbi:MAG: DUF5702 domain-containing protein [Lachnospiraceae bacterium]|jgi:hypothetical protein|nr:DUF5702 domain-containing protein [Lachnospiraceae bacterium]
MDKGIYSLFPNNHYLKGEVTVFLSLIFLLLMSFIGSIIQATNIKMSMSEKRADVNRGIESVFAEWQKDLYEKYDIFALDLTYEGKEEDEKSIIERLDFFTGFNSDGDVKGIRYLTDNNGQEFYEAACKWTSHKYGLDFVDKNNTVSDSLKGFTDLIPNIEGDNTKNLGEVDDILAENETSLPSKDNPIASVSLFKSAPLLSLVLPKEMEVSKKTIDKSGVVSERNLRTGYGEIQEEQKGNKLFLITYLLAHFNSFVANEKSSSSLDLEKDEEISEINEKEEDKVLDYELEYLLEGKESDASNLQAVCGKILALRTVPNFLYLSSDQTKIAEARTAAVALSSLVALPAISEGVTWGIIAAWAFGESIIDIRNLLSGRKVPLTKTAETFSLTLTNLYKLAKGNSKNSESYYGKESKSGNTYEDYLKFFLLAEGEGNMSMRSLDLIEKNLNLIEDKEYIKMDNMVSKINISSTVKTLNLRTYKFKTYYGYR